jgi:hypothetical protein
MVKKYIVEFIGTFFLVLTVGCTVIGNGAGMFAPLAIGSVLMVMIFAGGHISGGHFNPAVTLGVWLRGKCEAKDVAPYMISQIIGAVLAAFTAKFLKGAAAVTPLQPATVLACLCRTEHRYCRGYVRQFLLRASHRIHSVGGGVFRRQHFRRSVQPCGRCGHLGHGVVILAEYLDLPCSRFCWRRSGGGRVQGTEPSDR